MDEAVLPLLDRLVELQPINQLQRMQQAVAEIGRERGCGGSSARAPATTWKNLAELDQIVTDAARRRDGRHGAPRLLERAYPAGEGPLGRRRSRSRPCDCIWASPRRRGRSGKSASSVPSPAVRDARIGAAFLAEGQFDEAPECVRAGPRGRPQPVRGPLRPGRPRAGRRPRLGRLRARPAPRSSRPRPTSPARPLGPSRPA